MPKTRLAILTLLLAAAGLGQAPGEEAPALSDLALQWARGEYRAPLICEIDGVPRRALRRILVNPGPRHSRTSMNRLAFFDLEAPEGTRCHDQTGADEPNLIGSLALALEAHSRPDTAHRDFDTTLRRKGGFDFRIRAGRLRIGAPGEQTSALSEVDFSGGTASIHEVKRGSDAFRRLAEFGQLRKLRLVLEARDGTRLSFDLVQFGLR